MFAVYHVAMARKIEGAAKPAEPQNAQNKKGSDLSKG
jgi:hypothetical protein